MPAFYTKFSIPYPRYANPADVAMKMLDVSYPKTAETEERIMKLVELYEKELKTQIEDQKGIIQLEKFNVKEARKSGPWCTQFKMLVMRNRAALARDP